MRAVWLDIRLAARSLRKSPGFTAVVVLTVAVGIGFGSANFSVIHELLVRPLDVPELDRLALIEQKASGDQEFSDPLAPRTWLDLQKEIRSFEALAAYRSVSVSVTGAGVPEQVLSQQVSPLFFPLLKTPAALGRRIAPDEIEEKSEKVAVLSDGLWRRRFGADPTAVGKAINLDGASYTVVGVMPRSFRFPGGDLWTPLSLTPAEREDRAQRVFSVIGRLRAGVDMAEASAEVHALGQRHAVLHPATNAGVTMRAIALARGLLEEITRAFIYTLMAAAAFVLLIVCSNVANLLLARGLTRRREMAVRAALGGSRWRLVRQLLIESLLLSLLAGIVSLLVASWSLDFIKGSLPPELSRFLPRWESLGIDVSVLWFTLVVALGTALLFGLAPALALAHTPIAAALKDSSRAASGSRGMHRVRSMLVVLQLALALVLLVGAGIVVRAFVRAANPHRGVEPAGVLTMVVNLPQRRYPGPGEVLDFQQRALAALRGIPGVADAAAVSNLPWGRFNRTRSLSIDGRPEQRPDDRRWVDFTPATPGYGPLLQIPLRAGAPLTAEDNRVDARPVALVSETAARLAWPGGDAIGGHFRLDAVGPVWTVVGIVGDVYNHYDRNPRATVYVPYAQAAEATMYLVLRTPGDPATLASAAGHALANVDPQLPVQAVRPLADVLDQRVAPFRLGAVMMAAFAVVAFLLAALGIYGVVAYLVQQRRREIGIRLALGARPRQVLQLVVGGGARLALAGVALGVLPAFGVLRLMSATLFDLVEADGRVIAVVSAMIAAVALLGTLLPAHRAAKVDPMITLRSE